MVLRKVLTIAGLSYLSSQVLLVFHLLYSQPKNVDTIVSQYGGGDVSESHKESRKTLVEGVLKAYMVEYSNDVMKHYSPKIIFEDPIVLVEGRSDVATALVSMESIMVINETKFVSVDVFHGKHVVVMNVTVSYVIKGIGYRMCVPTLLSLVLEGKEGSELIVKHHDCWTGKPLIGTESKYYGLGHVARQFKRLHTAVFRLFISKPKGFEG